MVGTHCGSGDSRITNILQGDSMKHLLLGMQCRYMGVLGNIMRIGESHLGIYQHDPMTVFYMR